MQLNLNLRRSSSGRWMIYCSPAGASEPEIGHDRIFATLDELASTLANAGISQGRHGPTIRAANDGYESGFLISPTEAHELELLDDGEDTRRYPVNQTYRRIR